MKLVIGSAGLEQLKQITEIASHDYLPGDKVNKEGKLMRFYGFDIVECQLIPDGTGDLRNAYAFRKGIIRFYEPSEDPLTLMVNPAPTKGTASIIYQSYMCAAMRIEDSGIVNIEYHE